MLIWQSLVNSPIEGDVHAPLQSKEMYTHVAFSCWDSKAHKVEVWLTASPEFSLSPIVSDLNRRSRTQSLQAEDRSADSL
jgi:hypothetical protein